MRTATLIALVSFALSFPLGCSGLGGQQTRSVWVSRDGSPVSPDAAAKAEGECDRVATAEMTNRSRRQMNVDWAAAKRQCMADRGLVLTTQPVR